MDAASWRALAGAGRAAERECVRVRERLKNGGIYSRPAFWRMDSFFYERDKLRAYKGEVCVLCADTEGGHSAGTCDS